MKIKKKTRFKISVKERELMIIRASMDYMLNNYSDLGTTDTTLLIETIKKLRFEK